MSYQQNVPQHYYLLDTLVYTLCIKPKISNIPPIKENFPNISPIKENFCDMSPIKPNFSNIYSPSRRIFSPTTRHVKEVNAIANFLFSTLTASLKEKFCRFNHKNASGANPLGDLKSLSLSAFFFLIIAGPTSNFQEARLSCTS